MTIAQQDEWKALEIDIANPELLATELPPQYACYYDENEDRPDMMSLFDSIVGQYGQGLLEKVLMYQMNGGKLVGTYCAHIPNELIYAAGAIPLGLCSANATFAEMGEQYMPPNTCPLVRASISARLAKACPYAANADLLIGETSCDAKTKAWAIMDDDPETDMHVIYLPKRKERSDFEHFKNELYIMIEKLEEVTGFEVTEERLRESIKVLNDRRRAINRMWDFRKGDIIPISGKDCLLVQECVNYIAPKQYAELVNQLCDELDERVARGINLVEEDTPRILISGSPTGLQGWNINSMIEKSGGMVVVEETCGSTRLHERLLSEEADSINDMLENTTDKYFNGIHCACFTPNPGRMEDLLRLSEEYQIDGVMDINLKFCQIFDTEQYFVSKALDEEGIPNIHLEVDYGDDSSGQMLTRIQAFLEMIA